MNFKDELIKSNYFNIEIIKVTAKADKLFICFLLEIEKRLINPYNEFTIFDITNLIPIGTVGITNPSAYGFFIMSMFSSQRDRDYFIFNEQNLMDEFTDECRTKNRNDYYWRSYKNAKCRINPKYIKGEYTMSKVAAGKNEKEFENFFIDTYGEKTLHGKRVYKDNTNTVSISVDNSIDFDNKQILIEIDSGNMAKLLVGQYVLLNELYYGDKDVLFLIIHYYNGYNPQRTINNLSFINKKVYDNKGFKFKIFHIDEFKQFCKQNNTLEKFIKKLSH